MKGITGNQRQHLTRGRLHNPRLIGTDNIGELDAVEVALAHSSAFMALGAASAQSTAKQKVAINHLPLFTLSSLEFSLLVSYSFTISFEFPETTSSLDSVRKAFI
jgi:hypothetical protein